MLTRINTMLYDILRYRHEKTKCGVKCKPIHVVPVRLLRSGILINLSELACFSSSFSIFKEVLQTSSFHNLSNLLGCFNEIDFLFKI